MLSLADHEKKNTETLVPGYLTRSKSFANVNVLEKFNKIFVKIWENMTQYFVTV